MTNIEWTDETWNPTTGCTKVSAGCAHCYAERESKRHRGRHGYPADDPFRLTLHENRLEIPLHWRKPRMVFVDSMSDLFHPDVPDEFIDKVFAVMALCPQHTFQVLTKRPERMVEYFALFADPSSHLTRFGCWASEMANVACDLGWRDYEHDSELQPGDDDYFSTDHVYDELRDAFNDDGSLPNVWLGTSVEDQKSADERIPHLLRCPAVVRFLSCEPLLERIDCLPLVHRKCDQAGCRVGEYLGSNVHGLGFYKPAIYCQKCGYAMRCAGRIHWAICGGESGPGARPMHPDWARSLRDQCNAAGVPFFFKQWGAYGPDQVKPVQHVSVGSGVPMEEPVPMFRVGKKAAGRLLDGREWNEMPDAKGASA